MASPTDIPHPFGRLATRTDARGVAVSYSYDILNRLQTVTYPGGVDGCVYDLLDDSTQTTPNNTSLLPYDCC